MADQNIIAEINVYDFDYTIYDGDCSLHFYFYCIRRQPLLVAYLPYQLVHLFMLLLKLEDRTRFKSHFFVFLRGISGIENVVDAFWESNYIRIKDWYQGVDHLNDVIVSASPEFLLRPAFERLGARTLIATQMDAQTGTIKGKNCRGPEKIVRLRDSLGEIKIQKAYTDSLSDMPLLSIARQRYIVRGNNVLTLEAFAKLPRIRKITIPDPVE